MLEDAIKMNIFVVAVNIRDGRENGVKRRVGEARNQENERNCDILVVVVAAGDIRDREENREKEE